MNNPSNKIAAIDIGTNSIKMVIAVVDPTSGSYSVVVKEREMVRLGCGSSDMKHLQKDAMDRGICTLKKFKRIAVSLDASIRAVATSAVREAENKEAFLKRVKRETGIDIEVISGAEEGRLIYLGILQGIPSYDSKVFVITIGGGSTEFILAKSGNILKEATLKLGSNRLTERFFENGVVKKRSLKESKQFISGMIDPVRRVFVNKDLGLAIATSGTISALMQLVKANIRKKILHSKRDDVLNLKDLSAVRKLVVKAKTPSQRAGIPGMEHDRLDIIVAGTIILEEIMREFGIRDLYTSDLGLREGLVFDSIEKLFPKMTARHENIRKKSIEALAAKYHADKRHYVFVANISTSIFDITKRIHGYGQPERDLLWAAAMLHDIGFFVSHDQHHIHSYYLIRNAELLGFSEKEKEIIANIARYHRKSHPKQKHEAFRLLSESEKKLVKWMAAILRIGDGLDRNHLALIKSVKMIRRNNKIIFNVTTAKRADISLDIWGANRKKSLFEEMSHVKVILRKVV